MDAPGSGAPGINSVRNARIRRSSAPEVSGAMPGWRGLVHVADEGEE